MRQHQYRPFSLTSTRQPTGSIGGNGSEIGGNGSWIGGNGSNRPVTTTASLSGSLAATLLGHEPHHVRRPPSRTPSGQRPDAATRRDQTGRYCRPQDQHATQSKHDRHAKTQSAPYQQHLQATEDAQPRLHPHPSARQIQPSRHRASAPLTRSGFWESLRITIGSKRTHGVGVAVAAAVAAARSLAPPIMILQIAQPFAIG